MATPLWSLDERRRSPSDMVGRVFVAMILATVALLAGSRIYDGMRREQVRPAVLLGWATARRAVADRLKQHEPLEFGAVWATHSRLYCGMVNGWGSFGGLTGMTPFAVEGRRAMFALDTGALQFAPYWRACMGDQWIAIHDGSMEAGWCATKLGQRRCVTGTTSRPFL